MPLPQQFHRTCPLLLSTVRRIAWQDQDGAWLGRFARVPA